MAQWQMLVSSTKLQIPSEHALLILSKSRACDLRTLTFIIKIIKKRKKKQTNVDISGL